MKNEIRLFFEYQCYPIWIYDENGMYIDNELVEEIKEDKDVLVLLEELQNKYDSLFLNTKEEFRYIGFDCEQEKEKFAKKVDHVYIYLCNLLKEKYVINNMTDIESM